MARSARSKGTKDKKYLAFIASQWCVVCELVTGSEAGTPLRIEVAHVGRRGLSQKSSDRETIPLCTRHHRTGKDAHHVLGRKVWEHHGLDRDAIILELNARYEQEKAA
jgi:hypothetical protein